MNVLVSIIIPSYNSAAYIVETIKSVQQQTLCAWECIIVDNASDDNTEEVIRLNFSDDARIRYFRLETKGVSKARNYAVSVAQGKYILPLDSDDKIGPVYLEKAVQVLDKNNDVKLVYANAALFGAVNREWTLPEYDYRDMFIENSIYCSAVFRREDFLRTSGYNENMKEGFEDWDFWLSFLSKHDKVLRLPEVLFFYRIRENSRNNSLDEDRQLRLRRQIFENHKEKYAELFNSADFVFEFYKQRNELKSLKGSKVFGIAKSIAGLMKPFRK